MEFPTVQLVFSHLRDAHKEVSWADAEDGCIDVRLQVYPDGGWAILTGDPSYDTDHRGFCGSSLLSHDDTEEDLLATADDLVSQCQDDAEMAS